MLNGFACLAEGAHTQNNAHSHVCLPIIVLISLLIAVVGAAAAAAAVLNFSSLYREIT